jgi:hypothetical protein
MEQLYRAIVGSAVEPIMKGAAVPSPYRQTLPAPLAPAVPAMPQSESELEKPSND